jgi:ATP-dependent DNA helicase RecG
VNVAETKGSGIRAMRELMQQHDLLPPTFESSRRPDQFVATFLFHHFLGPADLAWLRALTPQALSDEDARALVAVRELGAIDNAVYRNINRTDTLDASTHLRRLRDLDLLSMKGSGSRTYYVPGSAFSAIAPEAWGAIPTSLTGDTHQGQPDTHQVGPNTHQPSGAIARSALPAALLAQLPHPGTKPRRAVMRAVLVNLCAWKPLSARDLAALLGRQDHKHLVRELLTPMVAEGLLAHTIPGMEKHPDQRYTARAPMPPAT